MAVVPGLGVDGSDDPPYAEAMPVFHPAVESSLVLLFGVGVGVGVGEGEGDEFEFEFELFVLSLLNVFHEGSNEVVVSS